tara:strand:- start:32030 stop:32401 length:372 start_codon:yes stop_codon:yes gene_type:complete
MSITHETAVRNSLATVVSTAVDAGTGAGDMVLSVGATEVATLPLSEPSFAAPASGVMALDVTPVPEDSSATGNASSVDTFEIKDGDSTTIITGAVPADLTLSKNPIDAADVVQLTSFSYTAPA